METNQENTEMANIYKVQENKLDEFQLNPRNIRTLDSIKIVPIEGVDEEGNLKGFQLGEFQCSAAYRREFDAYLGSLLTIKGTDVYFSTLENAPIVTTWKQALEEGGAGYYWVVDGNTRISIAKQLKEMLGESFKATIHYTHYKGDIEIEQLLFAAPTLGYNSKVPVLVEDTVQATKYFKHLTAKGMGTMDAVAQIKETFLKSTKNPTGWSVAKLSYVTTNLALGIATGVLAPEEQGMLNTEFTSLYLRYWYSKVTGNKYRVSEIDESVIEEMKRRINQLGIAVYAKETVRLPDFRITSDVAFDAYKVWVEQAASPVEVVGEEVKEEQEQEQGQEQEQAEDLSSTLYAIGAAFKEFGAEQKRAAAAKVVSPLTAAIQALAVCDPSTLAEIINKVAEAVDGINTDTPQEKDSVEKASTKALKAFKALCG